MKYTTLFLFFMIISVHSSGQTESNGNNFKLVVNVFPNLSIGVLNNDGTSTSGIEQVIREAEISKPSVSANIMTTLKVHDNANLYFGLGYMNTGISYRKTETRTMTPDPALPDEFKVVISHDYIEFPLLVKIKVAPRFYGMAGISGLVNISSQSIFIGYYADETERDKYPIEGIRKLNMAAHLGFGYNYYQSSGISLYVQPHMQFGLFGIHEPVPLNRNMLSLGIATGVVFD